MRSAARPSCDDGDDGGARRDEETSDRQHSQDRVVGQFIEMINDPLGGLEVCARCCVRDANCAQTSRACGFESPARVFDGDTGRRRQSEPFGRAPVRFRIRLAMRHIVDGDNRAERVEQAVRRQDVANLRAQ